MMDFETLGPHVSGAFVFKGDKTTPFLAPRGIFMSDNKLYVSDTGRNRVFIWKELPKAEYGKPDIVLGQRQPDHSGRNSGGEVTGSTLHYPSGIWSNGKILIVADAWNHRVLIWNQPLVENGQAADVVLGQPNFETAVPNVTGIADHPSSKSLHWPYGVFSDGRSLWIADTGNRRILFFETIPTANYTAADSVIGQKDFSSKDFDPQHAVWPYSVKVSAKGQMIVADTQCYRNLFWQEAYRAHLNTADSIIGQQDFQGSGQNQYGLFPSDTSLNWTYDACFYKEGVLVNDTGNSRILWYATLPTKNNEKATAVIGKRDFRTGSENKDTLSGTASSLYWPFSISTQDDILAIADTGNHRLVFCKLAFKS